MYEYKQKNPDIIELYIFFTEQSRYYRVVYGFFLQKNRDIIDLYIFF